ncbi:metal-dependent hydrolase family protein [Aerosticca soli]|uniref:Xaa-Pro dipeptidase family enzyme n=1 Tax=Aerosticca soli TaxID=2010829 RepID=A0A2Z6E451_9GAMM|nr:amidohydrolase family protein [Aerosticca soli]BBD79875.1 Xaa-Pro dipeptidase family enzyme [Aerosticca soli]
MRPSRHTATKRRKWAWPVCLWLWLLGLSLPAPAQELATETPGDVLLLPARIWTGEGDAVHEGWAVRVHEGVIVAVGPRAAVDAPPGVRRIELPGATLTPGLIDLHAHLFLHPYDETPWNDQVLTEAQDYRTLEAAAHARATLRAGFTTLRDLGTEGAGFADVAVKHAIEQGLIPGPRLFVATRAIVATASYGPGPRGFRPDLALPGGAQEVSGVDQAMAAVREQAARGADWIKLYADYRVGPDGATVPTFTAAELKAIVETAHLLGRPVAAHAASDAGVRMAAEAGVDSIEHGYGASAATFRLLAQKGIAYQPTLTAVIATETYFHHYRPGIDPPTPRIEEAMHALERALAAHVTVGNGSDVGVFAHGDNWREPAAMVAAGMTPVQALHAATDVAARILRQQDRFGRIAPGLRADLAAFAGMPDRHIEALARPLLVMKDGTLFRTPAQP